MKILYTFDEIPCLARSQLSREVRVIESNGDLPLGVIDLLTCIESITTSSPEILSNLHELDYAVYTTDYTEPGHPLVGHGMFSWLNLAGESQKSSNCQPKYIVGRVCENALAVFSGGSKETLEINLRLKPLTNRSQAQYLKSIELYKSLASVLPADFNHPDWSAVLSQNINFSSLIQTNFQQEDMRKENSKRSRPNDDVRVDVSAKRPKTASPANSISYESDTYSLFTNQVSSSPPSMMSTHGSDSHAYSSPMSHESIKSQLDSNIPLHPDWQDTHTSPIASTSPIDTQLEPPKLQNTNNQSSSTVAVKHQKIRVIARRTKSKTTDGSTTESSADEICGNCGIGGKQTWRRFSVTPCDSEEEIEYILCNPCGLWLRRSKEMRPSSLWSAGATNLPSDAAPPKTRTRRKGTKADQEYAGPSIRALLAQNRTETTGGSLDPAKSTCPETVKYSENNAPTVSPGASTSAMSTPEDTGSKDKGSAKKRKAPAPKRARKTASAKVPLKTKALSTLPPSEAGVDKENQPPPPSVVVDENTNNPVDYFQFASPKKVLGEDGIKMSSADVKLTSEELDALIQELGLDKSSDINNFLGPMSDSVLNNMDSIVGHKGVGISSSPPQIYYDHASVGGLQDMWNTNSSPEHEHELSAQTPL